MVIHTHINTQKKEINDVVIFFRLTDVGTYTLDENSYSVRNGVSINWKSVTRFT